MGVQHLAHTKYHVASSCSRETSQWGSNHWAGDVSSIMLVDAPHQKGWKDTHASSSFPWSLSTYEVQGSVQSSEQICSLGLGAMAEWKCSKLSSAFTRSSYDSGQGGALGGGKKGPQVNQTWMV